MAIGRELVVATVVGRAMTKKTVTSDPRTDRAQTERSVADTLNSSVLLPAKPESRARCTADEILLTEHDLAHRQNRSVKTIRNQRVLGTGIPFVKIGHLVRYRLRDVIESEEHSFRKSTSEYGGHECFFVSHLK